MPCLVASHCGFQVLVCMLSKLLKLLKSSLKTVIFIVHQTSWYPACTHFAVSHFFMDIVVQLWWTISSPWCGGLTSVIIIVGLHLIIFKLFASYLTCCSLIMTLPSHLSIGSECQWRRHVFLNKHQSCYKPFCGTRFAMLLSLFINLCHE
jgi:hypothetical protein